jgi:hypothetical protein
MLILEIAAGVWLAGAVLLSPFYRAISREEPHGTCQASEKERFAQLFTKLERIEKQWKQQCEDQDWAYEPLTERRVTNPNPYYPVSWLFSRKLRAS